MHGELPQEYVARVILPHIRGALAHCLRRKGLSQRRIARLLGVTQPMVYRYLREREESYIEALAREGIGESTVRLLLDIACDSLIKGDRGEIALAANTLALHSSYCRGNRSLCESTLCSEKPAVLKAYYKVLESLVSLPIIDLIPEVGSNLAYAPPGAEKIDDVIGLDGRIVKTATGRVIVAGTPVYGGSKHTGAVALKYAKRWGTGAWATVVKYDARVIRILEEVEGVEAEVEMADKLEPVIYLVSRDAGRLLEAIRKLAGVED